MAKTLEERFEQFEDESGKFELIENPLHPSRDIHAFLLLASIIGLDKGCIVAGAEHDEIYLETGNIEEFEATVTDEQIRNLARCGITYTEGDDYLHKYV